MRCPYPAMPALLVLAALLACGQARGSGFSFTPAAGELWLVLAVPVLAGLLTGALAGWRRWRFWRPLLNCGVLALALLLLVFLQRELRFFALVAVPLLLAAYLLCHVLAQVAWTWCRMRRRQR